MGLNWGCPSNSSHARASPGPPQSIDPSLPLACDVAYSYRQCRWHPFSISLSECAAPRRPADRRLSLLVPLPAIGCRKQQPISARPWTPEVWQIEYPRSVPARSETPFHGNRLQRTAALKEIGRSVYF
jgi:hypothetical protein